MSMQLIPMMDLELLTFSEINRIISNNTSFEDVNVREDQITRYLQKFNGRLIDGKRREGYVSMEEYVTAGCIYSFAKPLLRMNFVDKEEKIFRKIIAGSPYDLEHPLDLYFCSAENETTDLNSHEITSVDASVNFKSNQSFRGKVEDELLTLSHELNKFYSLEKHFSFIGYFDVCAPLFGVDYKKLRKYSELENELRIDHGQFMLKTPDYF